VTDAYTLEVPFLLDSKAKCRLVLSDESLLGSKRHFLRLDLYPMAAPSHMQRHYGWWDIPLELIRKKAVDLTFSPLEDGVFLLRENDRLEIRSGWRSKIREPGYCMLHVSLWEAAKDNPRMLTVHSSPHIFFDRDGNLPLKELNVPITDRCNLKCPMCPRQSTDKISGADVSPSVLQQLLRAAPDLSCVMLQGLGEPLLYEDLFDITNEFRDRLPAHAEIGLTTNATLLNEETATRLLESGIDFLYFSVDAATRQTYEKIRVDADFDQVVSNIARCARLRGVPGPGKPRLMINCLLLEDNLQEIPDLARLVAELGVENLTLSYCSDTQGNGFVTPAAERLATLFEETLYVAAAAGLNLNLPPLHRTKNERCLFMDRCVILVSGDVVPCHALAPGYGAKSSFKTFGNLHRTPVRDIWNSFEFSEFRRRVAQGDFPDDCVGCDFKAFLVS
jgi:radical SAM protein with 4Fe4S-binding SPASM domain